MGDFITMKESFFIAGVSITVVFLVLILISIMIYGLGFIKGEEVETKKPRLQAPKKQETFDIPEEVVAVISATLLCIIDSGKEKINISSIKRI